MKFTNKTKIIFIAIFFVGSIMADSPLERGRGVLMWNLNADRLQKGSAALRDYGANKTIKVCFNEKCFNVEIADTSEKRAIGLMNREYLNPDDGMLFVFDDIFSNSPTSLNPPLSEGKAEGEKYYFWMKNTLVPLDIIWLDKNKDVIFIKHNAEPCKADPCETFGPNKNAKYVLEINGGLAKKIKLKKGDRMEF